MNSNSSSYVAQMLSSSTKLCLCEFRKPHVGRTLVTSVLIVSDPGLSHASVSSLFLCREKERDVWASCLLLGLSSDGFNHSWVPSSFPHLCTLLFFSYSQPLPTTSRLSSQTSCGLFASVVLVSKVYLFQLLDMFRARFVSWSLHTS